jgi:hypothetical protein
MSNLLGETVAFVPCFMYKKSFHDNNEDIKPIRGVIKFVHERSGWFRVEYPAGNTVQHEDFKLVDIGKDVTVLGHKKNC